VNVGKRKNLLRTREQGKPLRGTMVSWGGGAIPQGGEYELRGDRIFKYGEEGPTPRGVPEGGGGSSSPREQGKSVSGKNWGKLIPYLKVSTKKKKKTSVRRKKKD